MNRDGYIARAAALQVASVVNSGGNFFCQQLPPMDIERFVEGLGEEVGDAEGISLALVGYGLSDTDLRDRFSATGLVVGHVTTDLYVAARWRNEPEVHSNIIALATGRHPGVSTLEHFPRGDTRAFALKLLLWAGNEQAGLASTVPQRTLLQVLAKNPELSPLVSLSGVAEFLGTWHQARTEDELGAPMRALPRLGLLPDLNLLNAPNAIANRLLQNFTLTQEIAKMTGGRFDDVRRRVKKRSAEDRRRGLDVLERAEEIRRISSFDAYSSLDYEEARAVFNPTSKPTQPGGTDEPLQPRTRDGLGVTIDGAELLIDGRDDELQRLVDSVRTALTDAVDGNDDSASGRYEVEEDEIEFEFDIEREVLTWVRDFCKPEVWGGFFEAPTVSLEDAVRNYRQFNPTSFEPLQASIPHDGERYGLRSLIGEMQRELSERVTEVDLCGFWDRIVVAREKALDYLDILIHQPMLGLAGQSRLRDVVKDLLQAWDQFYGKLAQHHEAMHGIDHAWTRLLFEAIATLDVVQIKTTLNDSRTSWKAILLPTHPLHLWRYERIAALARGLELEGMDRKAVLEQLREPEHYLGVIYLTSLPAGKGGRQSLPVARNYHGLAVFENLRNAYSGSDGVDSLNHCVRQFPHIYVNHTRPLRLALINPPNASSMLLTFLKRDRGRPVPRAPLLVDIYATRDHEARLLGARRFSTKDRDQIEDHIAAGRLQLRVNEEVKPLADRLRALRERPVHILAVFDEASTAMRHQPGGINLLPMSPFAIRRRIAFQGIHRKVELQLSHEESVFRSFYNVIAKLQGVDEGLTPQASADAEVMAEHINTAMEDPSPAAFWFFFADRALPSPGRVRVARILERQDGRRRSVAYDASYERLALLLRPPLDEFNLRFYPNELQDLLREGVALLGDGLIDLFHADAQPDTARVRGFAGMLVAARDYRARYPDALLVSVDTKLARLWLRLTDSEERCDLLALRRDDGVLIVDAIEVKTAGTSTGVPQTEIQKALSQLTSTLAAIESGLNESESGSPLAAPRQEMLKEVFVSGCQAITASPDDRSRWAEWLQVLFREGDGADEIRHCGTVYAIELSNNSESSHEQIPDEPHPVIVRRLRQARIQALVSPTPQALGPAGGAAGEEQPEPQPPSPAPPSQTTTPREGEEVGRPGAEPESEPRSSGAVPTPDMAAGDQGIRFAVGESISAGEEKLYSLHPSNTQLNQLNIGIVGDLGTGKTQLTKALIYQFTRQAARNREHVPKFLIFDYKRDYTKPDFVEAVGARVVSPHLIPLNVFDFPAEVNHLRAARLGRFKFLADALHKIYGGIGPVQRNHLKTAVMQAYEVHATGSPTLTEVLSEYAGIVGDRIDAPYSILSDLVDLEVFVRSDVDAERFEEFFTGVTVIDLAPLGVGDKERNMVLVLLLNLYYEYVTNLDKRPYVGTNPQLRFIDSMLLVDEADNIMRYNFDVMRQLLLQGREFGVGVLLASQFLSHFKTREIDYSEPLLTWFIHKVPNVTTRELQSIGLSGPVASVVDRVKTLDVHHCLYKTLDVPGRFMRALPFYEIADALPSD